MMEAWARAAGLNDEQTRALMKHHGGCPNTKGELTRTSQTLEGEFGYLMHPRAAGRRMSSEAGRHRSWRREMRYGGASGLEELDVRFSITIKCAGETTLHPLPE